MIHGWFETLNNTGQDKEEGILVVEIVVVHTRAFIILHDIYMNDTDVHGPHTDCSKKDTLTHILYLFTCITMS